MKRLAVAVLCALMIFSTVMPTTVLAKCSHKKTEWQTTQKASCSCTGTKTLVCKSCGKTIKKKTLPRTSHHFSTFCKWKPTCTDVGYLAQSCSVCGSMRTIKYGEALGHKWSKWKKSFITKKYSRHCTRSNCDAKEYKK